MFLVLILLVIFCLAYANGANDVSKGIATLVGSGVTNYRKAVLWGTIWTVAGALVAVFFSTGLIKTFSTGLLSDGVSITYAFSLAVAIGAFGWVILASYTGMPVSTTHSITGAIVGAGIMAYGGYDGILWGKLIDKVFIPLAAGPFISIALTFISFIPIARILSQTKKYCLCVEKNIQVSIPKLTRGGEQAVSLVSEGLDVVVAEEKICQTIDETVARLNLADFFHWLSSGFVSFTRGLNDAPKIAALALVAYAVGGPLDGVYVFSGIALAMGIGSYWYGLKVTETLSQKITTMDHIEGFSANFATAILAGVASRFGLPVSTTHVASGAIIGVGLKKGERAVRWKTVLDMLLAWIVTLPVSAVIAGLSYLVLSNIRIVVS